MVSLDRVIFHVDLNCFYASVELLDHPALRDKPVAGCGDPESRHGIILAKNEPAKRFGVQTAETIWQSQRKCPDLILLPSHHEKYAHYSRLARSILERYTDRVEPFGIDESWMDVTHSLLLFGGDAVALADRIRREMREELGLTVSVGVSFNKIFAKLGSDYKKPDATTVISKENFKQLVWPLPVTDLLFVGRASAAKLSQYGVSTIGALAAFGRNNLVSLLGKQGSTLYDYANGLEASPVAPANASEPPKSVGNGHTFRRNLVGERDVRQGVLLLADSVAHRLRKHALKATTLQVTIRDPGFHDICRQKKLPAPTCVARDLTDTAMELLAAAWNFSAPIRAITLTASGLLPEGEGGEQTDLFHPEAAPRRERLETLERTMDAIRARYGADAIQSAGVVGEDLTHAAAGADPESSPDPTLTSTHEKTT